MPPPYGVVSTGFNTKTQAEIVADLQAGYRGTFGAGVNLEASESTFGSEIGIISERFAELWQVAQGVYNAAFPDGAENVSLVNIGAITGSAKLPATKTKVDVTCYPPLADVGTAGATVIPINTELAVAGVGTKFRNPVAVPLSSGGFILASAVGEWVAVDAGTAVAPAGSVTVINTPVVGLDHVTNLLDHKIKGTDLETDAAFRLRRETSLRGLGNNSAIAIRAKVLAALNVTDCFVFENLTDATDAYGLPPHSFEAVVSGGLDATVAKTIYDNRPATGRSYGSTASMVIDAQGFNQIQNWSRPVDKNIYVTINVKVSSAFPVDGVTQIKNLIVAKVFHTGGAVDASPLLKGPLDTGIEDLPGVIAFPTLPLISFTVTPTVSTTLVLTNREKAKFDTSRIIVNLS